MAHPIIQANRHTSAIGRAAVFCAMRDEGPFVVEWVAHALACGFTDIFVAYNDCRDGTDVLLRALDAAGVLTAVINDNWRGSPQSSAYRRCLAHARRAKVDWIMVLDADEMLAVKVGAGRVADLVAETPEANLISVNWRLFGHGGQARFEDAPVARRFLACGPPRPARAQRGVKTLFRDIFPEAVVGPHRPRWRGSVPPTARAWVDGGGAPAPQALIESGWWNSEGGYGNAQVNHYAVRDHESFVNKIARGRASNQRHELGLKYWRRMSMNRWRDEALDLTATARAAATAALMAAPGVAKAHAAAVAAHKRRIEANLSDPDMRALYDALTPMRPVRPPRPPKNADKFTDPVA